MRKALLAFGAVFGLLLVLWVVAGAVVWTRNSYPLPALPARQPPPPNNAYPLFLDAVRGVKSAGEIRSLFNEADPAQQACEKVLRENATVLSALRAAVQRPSAVTDLEPGKTFVAAIDFPNVTNLLGLEALTRSRRSPAGAMEPLEVGMRFSEGVMRDGAMLQLLTGFLAYAPVFQSFPRIVSSLPADTCRKSAANIRTIIGELASLDDLVRNEHSVRFRQLTSTFPKPGSVFSFDFPWDGDRREFGMKPKSPAVEGLNRYFQAWQSQAEKPIMSVVRPQPPSGLDGILNDDSMGPEEMEKRFLQFHWRDARLKLIYSALRIELFRKEKGKYPTALEEMFSDPLSIDPFSGKPFVYRRLQDGYALYSVGPNGTDDAGASMNEARLNRHASGDLPLTPTFGRR